MKKILTLLLMASLATTAKSQILISGYMANPTGTDAPYEYVQLVATQNINFATNNYSVVWLNNGTATASGWILGGGVTYGFNLTSGSVVAGEVFYVGGSGKLINGVSTTDISALKWIRTINTGTTSGDGFGTNASGGSFGNGGANADGIGVFSGLTSALTSSTVPLDAVFYGTGIGSAFVSNSTGYQLPINDFYSGGKLQTNSTLIGSDPASGGFIKLVGAYNINTNTWTTGRIVETVTIPTAIADLNSKISLTTASNSYYFKPSQTDATSVANWGDKADGTGTAPANFTTSTSLFVINKTGTTTLASDWSIGGTLIVNTGSTLATVNTGKLILKSTSSNNTAAIGTSLGSINGSFVQVERYIPNGKRGYRFLSPSVSGSSIKLAWQEGANSSINNPNPTFGTHITGATLDQTNGFDGTTSGAGSLFTFDNAATQAWVAATNTDIATLNANTAYRLFIRGDRTYDLTVAPGNNNMNAATTLRAIGTLTTGKVIVSGLSTGTATDYSFIANPYASPIDWNRLTKTNLSNTYYIWDPTLSNRGAYVSFNGTTNNNGASFVNQHIQAGQAFFVQNTTTAPALVIEEFHKSPNNNTATFRTSATNSIFSKLSIQLLNNNNVNVDGTVALFGSDFSNDINDDDATKFTNPDENLAIKRSNKNLSIECRNNILISDTLPLNIWQLQAGNYSFKLDGLNFGNDIAAILYDTYLNTNVTLNLSSTSTYSFVVTNVSASTGANRFYIVLRNNASLPVTFTNIKAVQKNTGIEVQWNTVNEQNINTYEIEKSNAGISFSKIGTVVATSSNAYNFLDATPNNGNNYYRIKVIEKAGTNKYSQIVNVKIGKNSSFTIAPTLVQAGTVNVQFENIEKGKYTINLFNSVGQLITTTTINHNGGSATEVLNVSNLTKGTYQLQIAGNTNATKTIVIQ